MWQRTHQLFFNFFWHLQKTFLVGSTVCSQELNWISLSSTNNSLYLNCSIGHNSTYAYMCGCFLIPPRSLINDCGFLPFSFKLILCHVINKIQCAKSYHFWRIPCGYFFESYIYSLFFLMKSSMDPWNQNFLFTSIRLFSQGGFDSSLRCYDFPTQIKVVVCRA